MLSNPRALPPVTQGSALQASECLWGTCDVITLQAPKCLLFIFFTTDLTDWTDECPAAIEEIKKFVAFPGLTPLQPDVYAQPRKRASLSDPPHPSGLPTGRQESIKTK